MKPALDTEPLQLPARAIHSIEDGVGLEVTVIGGTVRITQARDTRDLGLARRQSFVIDRNGRAVVYALRDAAILVRPAGRIGAAGFACNAAA